MHVVVSELIKVIHLPARRSCLRTRMKERGAVWTPKMLPSTKTIAVPLQCQEP